MKGRLERVHIAGDAWVLARGTDVIPIPGTRRRTHLAANVEAAATLLDAGTLAALAEAVSGGEIAGARTSPQDAGIERQ